MSEPTEVEALIAAQEKEYGTYVAKDAIFYGGARAFNPGQPVPVSHVDGDDAWVSREQVEKVKAPAKTSTATETPKG